MSWETVPLGDVALVDARIVQPSEIDGLLPYVGLEHIGPRGQLSMAARAEESGLKSAKNRFDQRHILFGKLRPNLGKVARPHAAGVCSTDIYPVLPSPRVSRDYLAHVLLTPEAISFASSRTSGANLPRISWGSLRQLPIPLPPLPEQRRIAAILDEADALRSARRESLRLLSAVPGEVLAARDSRRWNTVPLGEVASLQGGLTVSARRVTLPQRAGYLRVANVFRGSIDMTEIKDLGVTQAELERTRIRLGDLLVVEGHGNPDEVGRAALVTELPSVDLTHQNHLFRLRPDAARVLGRFLELVLNSSDSREYFRRVANTTSGLNTLNATSVRSLRLRVAPLDIQDEIVREVDGVSNSIRAAERSSAQLDELFASLQHRAFRGEL